MKLGSSGAFPVSSILPIICTLFPPLVLHSENSFDSDPSSGFYATLRANALLFAHSLSLVYRGRRP